MTYLFVEMYNYTDEWRGLPEPDRVAFIRRLAEILGALPALGVDVLGYAMNDPDTDQRAPYDFFCVYQVRDRATQRAFEDNIRASGWYRYFAQCNLSGAAAPAMKILGDNANLLPPSA